MALALLCFGEIFFLGEITTSDSLSEEEVMSPHRKPELEEERGGGGRGGGGERKDKDKPLPMTNFNVLEDSNMLLVG